MPRPNQAERTDADAARLANGLTEALGLNPDTKLLAAYEPGGRPRAMSTASPTATCCRCTGTRVTPGGRVSAGTRQHRRVTLLHGDGPIGARLPLDAAD